MTITKEQLESEIRKFTLERNRYSHYYDQPLVGYASGNDSLFTEYKKIIGEFHWTPGEVFSNTYGNSDREIFDGTVVCWILPIRKEIVRSNAKEKLLPSEKWAHTRFYGEQINNELRKHLVNFLVREGSKTTAPVLADAWKMIESKEIGHASNWSERHAAYVAGLGTFSLNDALITAKGIAHRCGSVITQVKLEPSPRPYNNPYDYCLHYNSGGCNACAKRCPANAITDKGHDKAMCFKYIREVVIPTVNHQYQVTTPSCGLCQGGVPCAHKIPQRDKI